MINRYLAIFLSVTVLIFTGCDRGIDTSSEKSAVQPRAKSAQKQGKKNKYLAYVHNIAVSYSYDKIETTYRKILNWCAMDDRYNCTIVQSRLSTGYRAEGFIGLKILPDGVNSVLTLASEQGSVKNDSTQADDLGDQIVDNAKRIEMLTAYRDRLEALSQKPSNNLNTLMKISSEISKVQSDLEFAMGQKAKLLQRVNMDLVNIQLNANAKRSLSEPITSAFSEFGDNFMRGISMIIQLFSHLLPWLLVGGILMLVVRVIKRRR